MSNVQLSQLADILGGFAFKSQDLGNAGFPVIKITNIEPPNVNFQGSERVLPEVVAGLDRFKLKDGDIVMAMTGATTGKVGRIRSSETLYLNQRVAKLSAKVGPEYDDFIYAIVSQPGFDQLVMNNAHGSAQPNVSADGIGRILIPQFHLDEQLAIGRCIGALDAKVENNRKTRGKLERVVRSIYRAWFVDFEPVKAKAAGANSFTGMPQQAFDDLPNRLIETELGPVPEGWRVGEMGDIGRQRREPVAPEDTAEGTAYIGLEHMSRRCIALTDWGTADTVTSGKSRFINGDILFGKLRPYFHKVGPAPVDGVCSTDIVVLFAKRTDWAAWLLMLVSSDEFVSHANQTSAGTKMPRTNWKDMAGFPVVLPPSSLLDAFQQIATPMLDLVQQNIHESRNIAVLRNYLLPKLIRSEVKVAGVERVTP